VLGIVFFVAASSGPAPTRTSGDVAVTRAALAASVRVPDWRTLGTFLAPEPHLRVGILPGAPSASIAAASGVVVLPLGRDGAPEGDGFEVPRATFVPAADAGRLRLLEAAVVLASAAVVPAMPREPLSADGAPYRGYLEVAAEDTAVRVVNVVNIEDYLRGVVPNELSPGAGPEAVKAQAVAARTYALRQRGDYSARGYDLCATPACQVYRGRASEHPRADRAVAETRGLVVQYDGTPIKALYTSACGGHTENVENVFVGERERPYLRGVACTRERAAHVPGLDRPMLPDAAAEAEAGGAFDSGSRRWQVRMSPSDVARAVSRIRPLSDVRDVQLRRVSKAGRVVELAVIGERQREELVLKGLDVRKGLGLRENLFVVDRDTDARGSVRGFVFTGQGWGHGVGLCQSGAVGMAREGARFEQILTHYYTGVTLEKAY
jgi:stage II sporulation protein D